MIIVKTGLYTKLNNYDFEKLFKEKGYAYFTKGAYNLNIIGVRTITNNKVTNKFDDYIVVIYKNSQNKETRVIYNVTTKPGLTCMKQPQNNKGTAILIPNQYRGCWQIGLHKGQYTALCQRKPVKVYRDNNKNDIYDLEPKTIDEGIFGINIHRANQAYARQTIDMYSAGCQVFQEPNQFKSFMNLCKKQKELYGNTFTYTLIEEKDLV